MHLRAIRSEIRDPDRAAAAHWPALRAWLAEPLPDFDGEEPRYLEVGFQTGTDADNYPVDVPQALDAERPWFWLGFSRTAGDRRAAVVLWFVPTETLHALRDLPQWDTGNALGFDFIGRDDDEMRSVLQDDLARRVLDTFGALVPAAIDHAPRD